MTIIDIIVAWLIFLGAIYLLYRSLWKMKGHCSGCASGACSKKGIKKITNSEMRLYSEKISTKGGDDYEIKNNKSKLIVI
ncbi:hypothetical protein THER_0449 [Thermodesulfovibrio sp. N1]|uniref:FeoB-associated Cys-rich membrane protein n=1 Tax=unclassified Thermodesulfovibrio TaxID=2645936 RepID=UPI00083B103D|nr:MULTISPECIES: FeoB-associated Cys-rich membrane protein [unclassified Thermodesulfovibrio]MDI1471853.1 FeoB-associated Cys-rich membrane protein [Thermodesulfovibrio sp. 1176]ODA44821.1 hypothetical protein THER_0449 [Thermodesulfovibrio sp. N1]